MIGKDRGFLYGKSALYVAETPQAKAHGPYPAPADSIVPKPAFTSRGTAADTAGIKGIYAAEVPFPKPRRYAVLAVTKVGFRLTGAATEVAVSASSPIPDVGERPPRVDTDTVASSGGDIAGIDTRVPPDDMHDDTSATFSEGSGSRCSSLRRSVRVARLRPCHRHRAAAQERVRRPDDVHPPGGLSRQRPRAGAATAAASLPPGDRAVAVHVRP